MRELWCEGKIFKYARYTAWKSLDLVSFTSLIWHFEKYTRLLEPRNDHRISQPDDLNVCSYIDTAIDTPLITTCVEAWVA